MIIIENEKSSPSRVLREDFIFTHYSMSMHEVVVKVVAMAVSTVIRMLRILLQRVLFCMMFDDL